MEALVYKSRKTLNQHSESSLPSRALRHTRINDNNPINERKRTVEIGSHPANVPSVPVQEKMM